MCLNISYVTPYKETMLSISLQDAPEDEHEDVPTTPADRLAFFTNAHNVLLNCQTFTGLVRKCVQLEDEVSRFDLDVSQHSIVSLRGTVDRMAAQPTKMFHYHQNCFHHVDVRFRSSQYYG